ncbi:LPXTG-motif cell wall anchor domain protein [Striga asiatica]|uniref:LPXTG-motif cell wall anchor domain protein n=1 Tax=Striga asiatica TaxID=4170 RepID=A0A5A7QKP6_STRAF|nr:LPXTG-motif cell wall anchor domain protein [Striga asiatica]
MLTIPTAYTPEAPVPANRRIKTCSLTLNGPGLRVKDQPVNGTRKVVVGRNRSMNLPIGRATICTVRADRPIGFWRYAKNWFTDASRTHEVSPRNHVRKVSTGRVGSSVGGTVSRTSSIGWYFSSSPASAFFTLVNEARLHVCATLARRVSCRCKQETAVEAAGDSSGVVEHISDNHEEGQESASQRIRMLR